MTDKKTIDPTWLRDALSAARWTKSSRSSGGTNCVEIAFLDRGLVALRDSKNPDQAPHVFTEVEYTAFVEGIMAGELRRPT